LIHVLDELSYPMSTEPAQIQAESKKSISNPTENSAPVRAKTARKAHKTIDHRLAAKLILSGSSQREALKSAGYSPKTSAVGSQNIARNSRGLREALAEELHELAKAREHLPMAQARADVIRTQLMWNMLRGAKPGSNEAAKLLGQDREVNMWEPETAVGVAVSVGAVPVELRSELLEAESDDAD
jgi:hypothetical protein